MKTLLIVVICAILLIAFIYVLVSLRKKSRCNGECGCCNGCETEAHVYTITIDGMSCEHCKARVESAFNEKSGCCAEVNLEKKCAIVKSENNLTEEEIKQTVNDLGFTYVGLSEE